MRETQRTGTTEALHRLVDALSEYEREHFLSILGDVLAGERFWEAGIAITYNEHVKTRSSDLAAGNSVPAIPASAAGVFTPISIVKAYPDARRIRLPPPASIEGQIGAGVLSRRSRRDYTGEPISLLSLSTLLHHTCGVTGITGGYGYDRLPLRSFPSCGGLQAPEVYISVQAMPGLSEGLYHYCAIEHSLELIGGGNCGRMLGVLALGQSFVETAAAVVIVSGHFERMRWKYGERAYRYMCIDAGCVIENLYLVGGSLGLGVCAIAGFIDDAVEGLLGINGQEEMVLVLATVGVLPA